MAELEDVTLDGKPLNSLRVADLKTALEKRGLPKSGAKNALIKRLKGALMLENLQKTSTPHVGLQPNSQIGAEMSQNSFIQQYLAKQQELLRQRLEREANDAVEKEGMDSPAGGEGEEEDNNTDASDNSSYRPEHSVMPSRSSLVDAQEERGLDRDGPPRAVASLSVRVVGEPERQGPAMHIPQLQESHSTTTYAEAGSALSVLQHSRFAQQQAVSQSAQRESDDEDDDDDDDDDESEEDETWGPAVGKRGGRKAAPAAAAAAQFLPTPQRSRRKLQPPQHIPPPQPVHQPPLQLRQPTPPPSPPMEMSFPLPDTPKQSPPDLNQPGMDVAVEGPPAGLQRQDSSSSSRSSSPEPPSKIGRGPLSLLARKMESEGAFEEESAAASSETQGQKQSLLAAGLGVMLIHGGAHSSGEKKIVSPGAQPVSLPHGSEAAPTITFSSGDPTRGVITTLAEGEKTEHLQGPLEEEKKTKENEEAVKEDNDKPEDSRRGQQTPITTHQPLFDVSLIAFPPSTTASSSPPVVKRRTFSDVPPPKSLLSPTKSEPAGSDTSASFQPTALHGTVLLPAHQHTAQPPVAERAADTEMPKQAERRQAPEGTAQAVSLLPLSPPPDDAEAERKGREKERDAKRSTSASSDSDSSDSDSSDSSDSRDKSSPVSQKKGKQDQRRPDSKGNGRENTCREVKESALSGPADRSATELMEVDVDQPGAQGQADARAEPESSEELSDKSATAKGLPTRKISLSTSKSPGGVEGGSADTELAGGASKKRRWGSSTSVTAKKPSISITTDSLKSLIPDIKTTEEAVVELHPEDGCLSAEEENIEHQDRESDRDLKIRRTVTQVVPSDDGENGQAEEEEEEEEDEENKENEMKRARLDDGADISLDTTEKQGEAKKVSPSDSVTRRSFNQQKSGVSITIDDPVQVSKQQSPPRGKISKIIHIRNLVRPFTLGQLKELLSRTGTMVDEGFWIDKIKSHCFVTYSSTEEAVATRTALHGVKWPLSNPKVLSVDFCEQDELDFHKTGKGVGSTEAPVAGARASGPPPLMGNLERGPAAAAAAAGGARDQWAEREREMQRRERTRSEREWDRDKVREFAKAGEERDGRRSRSRERRRRERGKSQERKTEKKGGEEKKAAEEPPAKLLDDLFRKTKATPCIYWLPLTDEQSMQRDLQRAERRKERERRQKEMEEEEKKQQEEKKERGAQGRNKDVGSGGGGGGGGGGGSNAAATTTPTTTTTTATAGSRSGERDRPRDRERERDRDRDRERERERNRERDSQRDRSRDGHGDRRRDSYRSRGAEPRLSGGASRRSRSRSNPSRDRRH